MTITPSNSQRKRIERLEALTQAHAALIAKSGSRPLAKTSHRDERLAITVDVLVNNESIYPGKSGAGSPKFPIKFIDATFTQEAGREVLETLERGDPAADYDQIAASTTSAWVPPGTIVKALWQRPPVGLTTDQNAGEWFIEAGGASAAPGRIGFTMVTSRTRLRDANNNRYGLAQARIDWTAGDVPDPIGSIIEIAFPGIRWAESVKNCQGEADWFPYYGESGGPVPPTPCGALHYQWTGSEWIRHPHTPGSCLDEFCTPGGLPQGPGDFVGQFAAVPCVDNGQRPNNTTPTIVNSPIYIVTECQGLPLRIAFVTLENREPYTADHDVLATPVKAYGAAQDDLRIDQWYQVSLWLGQSGFRVRYPQLTFPRALTGADGHAILDNAIDSDDPDDMRYVVVESNQQTTRIKGTLPDDNCGFNFSATQAVVCDPWPFSQPPIFPRAIANTHKGFSGYWWWASWNETEVAYEVRDMQMTTALMSSISSETVNGCTTVSASTVEVDIETCKQPTSQTLLSYKAGLADHITNFGVDGCSLVIEYLRQDVLALCTPPVAGEKAYVMQTRRVIDECLTVGCDANGAYGLQAHFVQVCVINPQLPKWEMCIPIVKCDDPNPCVPQVPETPQSPNFPNEPGPTPPPPGGPLE